MSGYWAIVIFWRSGFFRDKHIGMVDLTSTATERPGKDQTIVVAWH